MAHGHKFGHETDDHIEVSREDLARRIARSITVLHDQDCDGQLVMCIEDGGDNEYLLTGWVQNLQGRFNRMRSFSRCGKYLDLLMEATMQMRADHEHR